MNPAQDILKNLVGELKDLAKTETIVGAPINMGEYLIVPISRVSLGVGAGGGTGEAEARKGCTGEGGGGGGGGHHGRAGRGGFLDDIRGGGRGGDGGGPGPGLGAWGGE